MMAREISIQVPEGLLRGEEAGTGSALVLLHGFSFDLSMWDPQFGSFAKCHRTVRYDLRGFGRSGRPASGHGHLGDLLAVLDALGIDRAHLAGLSLGANVALAAAMHHPDRVHSLVLASPGLPGFRWTTPRPPDEAAQVAREHGAAAAKRYWLSHEIFRSTAGYPEAQRRLTAMVERFPAHQWGNGPAAEPLPSLAGTLTAVLAPVLVLNGSLDVAGYRQIAAHLEGEIRTVRRRELAGSGHLVNLEKPAAFNQHVLAFLAEIDRRADAPAGGVLEVGDDL